MANLLNFKLSKIYEQKGNQTDPVCILWIEDTAIWSEVMGKEALEAAYSEVRTRYKEATLTELCSLRPDLGSGALFAESPVIVRVQSYDGLKKTIASRRFDLVIADLNILEVDPSDYDPDSDRAKYCPPSKLAELLEPLNFYAPVLLMTSGGSPNSANAKALRVIEQKFEAYTGPTLRDKLLFLKDNDTKEKLQSSLFDLLLIALRRDWQAFLDEEEPARIHKILDNSCNTALDIEEMPVKNVPRSFLSRLTRGFKNFTG